MAIHVYAQQFWHDDLRIVGDSASLRELALALDRAANGDAPDECLLFAADGEGYGVKVECREPTEADGGPYLDKMAGDWRDRRLSGGE